ncbi:MAG: hypothetical protein A07HB70_01920 [uncultured archaeon A07HB70]|nr:MAG: hypothetical protein A07HB70_01920 [uncultured archaeon A07HB70]
MTPTRVAALALAALLVASVRRWRSNHSRLPAVDAPTANLLPFSRVGHG